MAQADATIGTIDYTVDIKCGHHELQSDEPRGAGGQDAGPSPSDLLAAALAACTAITLRMYAKRKAWDLEAVRVQVIHSRRADQQQLMERTLTLSGALSQEQRQRCAEIAERTPVTVALKQGVEVRTQLAP